MCLKKRVLREKLSGFRYVFILFYIIIGGVRGFIKLLKGANSSTLLEVGSGPKQPRSRCG